MKRLLFAWIFLALASSGSARAAVFTEDFEGVFPAWESNWFGTESTGRNFYCGGALGCTIRGNNPDGLWIIGAADIPGGPVEVSFDAGFGASLTSLKLDVAGFVSTTLEAFDEANALIFSQSVNLTFGALTDPGTYATYTINSTNGISRFTFSGDAPGNTSIDNLVATTGTAPIPEPEIYAMMAAGLGLMGFVARRRKGQAAAA